MSHAAKIIDGIFGGARQMSRHLSVEDRRYPATTIQSWKDGGFIPAQHQQWVLQRGVAAGLKISPSDFFEDPHGAEAVPHGTSSEALPGAAS